MYSLVSIWQEGGQSKTDFCAAQQINIHTFTYWVQKYKTSSKGKSTKPRSKNFISLQVENQGEDKPAVVELCYPNGVRLRLDKQPSVVYLESLIRVKI